jgi:choline-sulfatase
MEHPGFPITAKGAEQWTEKYDGEINFEDGVIGEILDALDKNGLAATTTVILMSDHGEALGVHPGESGLYHGMSLYNEVLHVPLIFRVPGVKPAMRDDVVELIDMAPTIAALFGVTPPASWVGRSLVPAIAGGTLKPLPAFAELPKTREWPHEGTSMITADGKTHVFYKTTESRWEIYDLASDVDERKNVSDSLATSKDLQKALAQWLEGPLANSLKKN